jgi:hypothetical protein
MAVQWFILKKGVKPYWNAFEIAKKLTPIATIGQV